MTSSYFLTLKKKLADKHAFHFYPKVYAYKIGRVAELFPFNLVLIYQTVHMFTVLYVFSDKSSGICAF